MKYDFDLLVIGSGAAGGSAAHAAAAMGKSVAIIESNQIGGECPTTACVPTKALLHVAELFDTAKQLPQFGIQVESNLNYDDVIAYRNKVVSRTGAARGAAVFEDAGIDVFHGQARFSSPHEVKVGSRTLSATYLLIATGSKPCIPPIFGLDRTGYITYVDATTLPKLPESLCIIGGGPVGCEFAQIFTSFGTQVTLIDVTDHLLCQEDPSLGTFVAERLQSQGASVALQASVTEVNKKGLKKIVTYEQHGHQHTVEVDEILVAVGKTPTIDLDLERVGVRYDKHGILTDDFLQTSQKHIYAAGDVIGPPCYTSVGTYQAYVAVNNMFGSKKIKVSYDVLPRVVYLHPEIAAVGVTEAQARAHHVKTKVATVDLAELGRSNTEDVSIGFVKIITTLDNTIIGAAIAAPSAGEMIHELALAIKLGVKAPVIASMLHAYPTYSEAIKIACGQVSAQTK